MKSYTEPSCLVITNLYTFSPCNNFYHTLIDLELLLIIFLYFLPQLMRSPSFSSVARSTFNSTTDLSILLVLFIFMLFDDICTLAYVSIVILPLQPTLNLHSYGMYSYLLYLFMLLFTHILFVYKYSLPVFWNKSFINIKITFNMSLKITLQHMKDCLNTGDCCKMLINIFLCNYTALRKSN